jgi:hypothetical protein
LTLHRAQAITDLLQARVFTAHLKHQKDRGTLLRVDYYVPRLSETPTIAQAARIEVVALIRSHAFVSFSDRASTVAHQDWLS